MVGRWCHFLAQPLATTTHPSTLPPHQTPSFDDHYALKREFFQGCVPKQMSAVLPLHSTAEFIVMFLKIPPLCLPPSPSLLLSLSVTHKVGECVCVCVCAQGRRERVCGDMRAVMHTWRSECNLLESFSFFYHVEPRDRTRTVRLDGKLLYL
jgi:hypothetical protein